ncbi:MAG: type IV toxin-antitoxin system AbiEi family antitoxin domain-containing protein [Actinomycetota bacterium]
MHDRTKSRPDRISLLEVATEQGGYFTAAQAAQCGFSKALLAHHRKNGGFTRVGHGLYRFPEYPSSPREEVMVAWLGAGRDVAVVSHESALDLLGLSEVVPQAVHITVPRSKRYRPTPKGVAIHTTTRELDNGDVVIRDGIRVTSPIRSIVDAAQAGAAPEQVIVSANQAVQRGMATAPQLLKAASRRGSRVERLVREALRREIEG